VLFNYDRAQGHTHVVICEGPVDAIKVGENAVALLGKGTDAKIERLRRMNARRYTVYLDRGTEEREKAEWIASELLSFAPTFIATPPEGYDAGALSFDQNSRIIERAESVGEIGLQSDLRL
jgi:hypothetical protein